jgi:hypothetical protein
MAIMFDLTPGSPKLLPAECDAETDSGKPILMVNIDVATTMVGEMLLEIDGLSPLSGETREASPRRR